MRNKVNNKKYSALTQIEKRDGTIVPFDKNRVARAIFRAMQSVKEGDEGYAEKVMYRVLDALVALKKESNLKVFIPHVERIQDVVENELIASGFLQTAKAYIL